MRGLPSGSIYSRLFLFVGPANEAVANEVSTCCCVPNGLVADEIRFDNKRISETLAFL
jgi:hypothetical protein